MLLNKKKTIKLNLVHTFKHKNTFKKRIRSKNKSFKDKRKMLNKRTPTQTEQLRFLSWIIFEG